MKLVSGHTKGAADVSGALQNQVHRKALILKGMSPLPPGEKDAGGLILGGFRELPGGRVGRVRGNAGGDCLEREKF